MLGCIFFLLFCEFWARGPISIPTLPIVSLTEFFHKDAVTSVHLLPVSWYLCYECICVLVCILSLLWSILDAVTTGSCPILFKVLTLNAAICIVCLHFSNFCLSLSSVSDFRTLGRRLQPQQDAPLFLPALRTMWFGQLVWVCVMIIFRWLFFFFFSSIEDTHSGSSPIELLDRGRLTVGFIRPGPGSALRWIVRGFIRSHLGPPSCTCGYILYI